MTDDLAVDGDRLHALYQRMVESPSDYADTELADAIRALMKEADAALRTVEEREHYAATRDERITELLRELDGFRDEAITAAYCRDMADQRGEENERLRARCAAAEADADQLAEYLRTRSGSTELRKKVLAAHAAAVEARRD